MSAHWSLSRASRVLIAVLFAIVPAFMRAQTTEPPAHVAEFMQAFRQALSARGHQVDREAYHFVFLINTVRTAGAGTHWARDVISHFIHNYLTEQDRLSIVPYQLSIRSEALWDQAFSRRRIDEYYRAVPLAPAHPVEGHDTEYAVMQAVQTLGNPTSAIYITLSDSEASQRPTLSPARVRSILAAWNELFGSGQLIEATKGRISGSDLDFEQRPVRVVMYYRVYVPVELQSLSPLNRPRETDVPNGNGPIPWPIFLLLVLAIALVLAFILYVVTKPSVSIRIRQEGAEQSRSIQRGALLVIGGKDCGGIELKDLKDGEKVARIRFDWLRGPVVEAYPPYQIVSPLPPVQLTRLPQRITVKRSDETFTFEIWRS